MFFLWAQRWKEIHCMPRFDWRPIALLGTNLRRSCYALLSSAKTLRSLAELFGRQKKANNTGTIIIGSNNNKQHQQQTPTTINKLFVDSCFCFRLSIKVFCSERIDGLWKEGSLSRTSDESLGSSHYCKALQLQLDSMRCDSTSGETALCFAEVRWEEGWRYLGMQSVFALESTPIK